MRAIALLPLACAALDFFVAPSGSDASGTGSAAAPWASPLPAVAAIAAARASGPLAADVTVHLASGVYFLPALLNVSAASGGDGTFRVVFAGPADAAAPPAVLSAGAPVAGPWAPVAGAPGVFSAPFPAAAAGVVRQMWDAAGARVLLARSPVMLARNAGQWGAALPFGALSDADVPGLAEAELVIWHNWVSSQNRIAAVNVSNSSVTVEGTAGDPFLGAGGNIRVALQNVANATALAPGSFYAAARTLFFRPADGAPPAAGALVVERLPRAVALAGAPGAPVVGVSLENLTVAHAAADLEGSCAAQGCGGQSCSESGAAAVHARFAEDCHLRGVEVVGAGAYGVWWDEGSVACSIERSWLHDLGMGGVRVGSTQNVGSAAAEPTRNVSVVDNVIEDGGHVVPAGTGVLAQESVATRIEHNHIHHFFYTGVSTGVRRRAGAGARAGAREGRFLPTRALTPPPPRPQWTWGYMPDSDAAHYVGFNHIHDIFQNELSDGGCIYNLGRSPGTQIINNLCHDVSSYGYGGWGL